MRSVWTVCVLLAGLWRAPDALARDGATLSVQVIGTEDGLAVTEVLRLRSEDGPLTRALPLLLPVNGPFPGPKSQENPDGVDVEVFDGGEITWGATGPLLRAASDAEEVQARARYLLRATDERMRLDLTPDFALAQVQVITRRPAAGGIHLRPLLPYVATSEEEEDGTWWTMTLTRPVAAGERLSVAAARLPAPGGPYRVAAWGLCGLTIAGLCFALTRRRGRR